MQKASRPEASPFGRGVTEGDGEGKDADEGSQARRWYRFDKGVLIAARRLCCSWLALSGASRQLSQGESLNESHHRLRASSSRLRLGTQ